MIEGAYSTGATGVSERITLAVVGASQRAVSLLGLLNDLNNVVVGAVCAPYTSSPTYRFAEEYGIYATTYAADVFQVPGLSLIVDMSDDPETLRLLERERPRWVAVVGGAGSALLCDLLAAKRRSQEQERTFVELQVAYDKIRSHERRLQSSKEALERANAELETRLAEIYFTHEFFKSLTRYTSVDDVCSLVVDGCSGILGTEISCVYLFNREDWTLRLRACQGRPEAAFRSAVPVSDTILGHVFRDDARHELAIDHAAGTADWAVDPTGIASQAAVPLRAGEATFGVLVVASGLPRALSDIEMERLQALGSQSSLSLQNALLHGELERLSVTDRLTDLYNQGHFKQRLDEECNRSARFGRALSLIMLDIDDFKAFNDSWGHPRGDEVLRTVADVIRESLRDHDVAARYGGEEFVVLLPETDGDGALLAAERIRAEVEARAFVPVDGQAVGRTVSIGVATLASDASAAALLESADSAMYRAKRAGKNRVEAARS